MITRDEQRTAQAYAAEQLAEAGIVLTDAERDTIEIADFGLSQLRDSGLLALVYVNTDRYCAKELVLYPGQTCPDTDTPPPWGGPGKEERSAAGAAWSISMSRERAAHPTCTPPRASTPSVTIRLGRATVTIPPNTLHWFQAGPEGTVVTEFSSASRDELDVFTDPAVRRTTIVND